MGGCATHETLENSLKLDLATPAIRAALKPYGSASGTWTWSSHGTDIATVNYIWVRFAAQLTLRYACNGEPITQVITLGRTAPHFGGSRWWFVCPVTGGRVRALYLPPGATRWASRVGHDLRYQSQRTPDQLRWLVVQLRRDDAREARNAVRRIARQQRTN